MLTEVKFNLTKTQMEKLAAAHKSGSAVKLRLNTTMSSPTGIPLLLTSSEIKKLADGKSHDINISATRVKQGGFLPALLAAIPTIASVIGGISGLTGIASNIKKMVTDDKKKDEGKGLFLNPAPAASGLYLKQ